MLNRSLSLAVFAAIVLGSVLQVHAQDNDGQKDPLDESMVQKPVDSQLEEPEADVIKSGANNVDASNWTTTRVIAIVAVLLFGLALLCVVARIIFKTEVRWTPYSVLRIFGLSLIIFTAILVMLVPDAEVSKAIIGLLGAVAGYLLGKDSLQGDIAPSDSKPDDSQE